MSDQTDLSQRELEILKLVATGASNKEIAQQLYISTNTVKVHLRNIFSKIGAASRTEAAIFAVSAGLVEDLGGNDKAEQVLDEDLLINNENSSRAGNPLAPNAPTAGTPWLRWGVGTVILVAAMLILSLLRAAPGGSSEPDGNMGNIQATSYPRWSRLASLPTSRAGLALVAAGDALYAIGGETNGGVTGVVEIYDPRLDTWIKGRNKPTPVSDAYAVTIGGKIYMPGGRLASGEATDVLEVYDPVEDTWEQKSPLPVSLSAYALAAFEGNLYLFGGLDGDVYVDIAFEYNPSLDEWKAIPDMPTARAYAGAAAAGGKIFVVGGQNEQGRLAVNEVLSPEGLGTNDSVWKSASSMPSQRTAAGVLSIADIIYVIGGEGTPGEQGSIVVEYVPLTDEWQSVESMILNVWSHFGAAVLGTQLYMIGGRIDGAIVDQNLTYQAIFTVLFPVTR